MALRWAAVAVALLLSFAKAPPSSRALTFAILEDYDKGEDLAGVAQDFALMHELGISTWRGSLGWDDYEPSRGRYDFAWLHQFASLAAARDITLRPYLGYTPAWAAGGVDRDKQAWKQPPRDLRAWRSFAAAVAKELAHHTNVASIEIYNEENVAQWWEGSRRQYADTLVAASGVIRRARASFSIVFGGLVFPDIDWLEEVCSAKGAAGAFDVLPVHAYPETWTPAGVTVENYLGAAFAASFLPAADRACGSKKIWINETGFATTPGRSEQDQAAWWVRAAATFAAEPRIELIGVYEIKDLAAGKAAIGDAPNYHLGITRSDRSKKMAFGTVKMLAGLLGTAAIEVEDGAVTLTPLEGAGEMHHHVFRRADGDSVLIVWNRTADQKVSVAVQGAASPIDEYGLDGTITRLTELPREIQLTRAIPRVFRFR